MTEREINQTISDNLAVIRKNSYFVSVDGSFKRKVSQTEAGKVLNVTFQQIQKYEKGTNQISSAKLKILSDFYKIPIQQMYEPITTFHREITR